MTLWDQLPHRCTIRRKNTTRGSLGGSKTSTTEIAVNIECWEQNASHSEIESHEKIGMRINRKIYFDVDPGVDEQHEILITSRDRGDTNIPIADRKILEVRSEALPDTTAGLGVGYKVMAEEITSVEQ